MLERRHPVSILAPLDLAELQRLGLVGEVGPRGTRCLHKSVLSGLSNVVYQFSHEFANKEFITIPDELVSHATLEHVGFTRERASEIWTCWVNRPCGSVQQEVDRRDGRLGLIFYNFFMEVLRVPVKTPSTEDGEWRSCMRTLGLTEGIQQDVLDAVAKHLRRPDACVRWARYTVKMRFDGLQHIQDASMKRDQDRRRTALRFSANRVSGWTQ